MKQDKIWDVYQNDDDLVEFACSGIGRHELLAKKVNAGQSVLNIGVGSGSLERLLAGRAAIVHCLDPNQHSVDKLREALQLGDRAQVGYSQNIPFEDQKFDLVIMSEVLEHLDDDVLSKTLAEVKRVLVPDGRFIGTVPADENLIESTVVCPKCGDIFHRWGHVRSFSAEVLQETLEATFSRIKVERRVMDDVSRLNWKGKFLWLIRSLQARLNMSAGNQNFYFEALP